MQAVTAAVNNFHFFRKNDRTSRTIIRIELDWMPMEECFSRILTYQKPIKNFRSLKLTSVQFKFLDINAVKTRCLYLKMHINLYYAIEEPAKISGLNPFGISAHHS